MESDLNGDSSDYYRQFMPAGSERHCFFGTFTEHKRRNTKGFLIYFEESIALRTFGAVFLCFIQCKGVYKYYYEFI